MDQNPKPNRWHALAFLKVGLFEFVFVAVALFLLFGTLNYFNILPVSEVFPNQLGWLPQKEVQNGTYQKEVATGTPRQKSQQNSIPTLTLIPKYIKSDVKSLISDIVMQSLIPDNLVVKKQNVENPNNFTFYGAGWETLNKETFVVSVEYNQEENIIDRQIVIHIPKIFSDLDASSSSSLIKDYLTVNPPFVFSCISLPTIAKSIFCEVFWEDNNGLRKGINVISPVQGLQETQVLYCEHYKGTIAYSWKSCSSNYRDTGI